jgi:glycine/D-amino acid oxidase-like deaminating enzyme
MKSSDVIIIGAGIIGLSLAIELRKKDVRVLMVERGEPGREASHAAAGMLAASGGEIPAALKLLAEESARMYPEFVHELEDESGLKVDLREQGTIVVSCDGHLPTGAEVLSPQRLKSLEPAIDMSNSPLLPESGSSVAPADAGESGGRGRPPLHKQQQICAAYLPERSVDPRALVAAAIKAARQRRSNRCSSRAVESAV